MIPADLRNVLPSVDYHQDVADGDLQERVEPSNSSMSCAIQRRRSGSLPRHAVANVLCIAFFGHVSRRSFSSQPTSSPPILSRQLTDLLPRLVSSATLLLSIPCLPAPGVWQSSPLAAVQDSAVLTESSHFR